MSNSHTPSFVGLRDANKKSRLRVLRGSVTQILANNLLPHYTDHSVAHSDRMVKLLEKLLKGVSLSDDEFFLLYAACYVHDLGMQYENVGKTQTILKLGHAQGWKDLSVETRRRIIRENHHVLSAELVMQSATDGALPFGMKLVDEDHADYLAALCEAHGLDTQSDRYRSLTEGASAGVRLALLSGLLRVADILDECRKRALRDKAQSLLLDLDSQVHWWRTYYTEDVSFCPASREIWLEFDFPAGREREYSDIVPALQVPSIQREYATHSSAFNKVGISWSINHKILKKAHGTTAQMPDAVLTEMLAQIQEEKTKEAVLRKQHVLRAFREAQPVMDRRLKDLEARKASLLPKEHAEAMWQIAKDFEKLDATRSSWMLFSGHFRNAATCLPESERIDMGMWLVKAMLKDAMSWEALDVIRDIDTVAQALPNTDPGKGQFLQLKVQVLVENCAYPDAVSAAEAAIQSGASGVDTQLLESIIAEVHFLQGEMAQAVKWATNGGHGQ